MYLQTKAVVKRFGGLVAVNNVSIEVPQGVIWGIIGPNGAGKSTLLNCIAGAYKPEEGKVLFKDEEITGLKPNVLCHRGIARTYQLVRSFQKLTALENVLVGAVFGKGKLKRDRRAEDIAAEMLEKVGFQLPYDTPASILNTVQLKYVELARTLASGCELLLLDEVAAGITPGELPEFIDLIKRVKQSGVTLIVVEHVMKFIMELCDRISVIHYGEKIAEGTPAEIVSNEQVTRAYLGDEIVH